MQKEEFVSKHFPELDPGREPLGNKITVQLLHVPKKSSGGIILSNETKDFNKQSTTVARVVKVGQIAYRDRGSGEVWKEGAWCEVGDLVLVHRYGGMNRIELPHPEDPEDTVIFCTYNDYDVLDKITGQFEHYAKIL
jgi:co-chaperonin GroES (HSP10)